MNDTLVERFDQPERTDLCSRHFLLRENVREGKKIGWKDGVFSHQMHITFAHHCKFGLIFRNSHVIFAI